MTTTTTTTADELERAALDAGAEATEAEQLAGALEERMLDGDDDVQPTRAMRSGTYRGSRACAPRAPVGRWSAPSRPARTR